MRADAEENAFHRFTVLLIAAVITLAVVGGAVIACVASTDYVRPAAVTDAS